MVAMALGEPGGKAFDRRLARFERRAASNLLEAEVRAALSRERVELPGSLLNPIEWVLPTRPLEREIEAVLAAGCVRGPDVWHLACALYAADGRAAETTFLTLDEPQRAVAEKLGFAT